MSNSIVKLLVVASFVFCAPIFAVLPSEHPNGVIDALVENAEKGDVEQITIDCSGYYGSASEDRLESAASVAAVEGKTTAVRVLEGVKDIVAKNRRSEKRMAKIHLAEKCFLMGLTAFGAFIAGLVAKDAVKAVIKSCVKEECCK